MDERAEPARFRHGLIAVDVRQVVFPNDHGGVDALRGQRAQHFHDPPERGARRRRPSGDLGRHHLASHRPARLPPGNVHVDEQPAVERHDEGPAGLVDVIPADDARRPAFEDPQDASFGPISVPAVLDAHDDAIAVYGLVEARAGHEDARRTITRFRLDERKAARVGRHAADDEIHQIGEPEAVTADFDEGAACDERSQVALEAGSIFLGQSKQSQQFFDGGRMIDALADRSENVLF